jgi:hypothetical protein
MQVTPKEEPAMRRVVVAALSFAALAAVPSAQACDCGGCPPVSCGTTSTSTGDPGRLLVHNFGQQGQLDVFDVATGRHSFRLPPGRVSADGRRFFASLRSHGHNVLRSYDVRSGRLLHAWPRGRGPVWSVGGVSANGRLLALVRPARKSTLIRLVDGARGHVVRALNLHGWFDVDAVSNDGTRLFLVQYVDQGYLIRRYDFGRRELAARPLTERGEPMNGTAWDAVASPNGRWLLTLYLRGYDDAEVHTLDLVRGTAVCIHLPGPRTTLLSAYSLALARGGRTLYAANPALGVVATIDLPSLRVVRVVRFHPAGTIDSTARAAAVSHDGRTVYFAAGPSLYAYDAAYHRVRGPYAAGSVVAALAFSPSDRMLLVVGRDGRALRFHAANGRRR